VPTRYLKAGIRDSDSLDALSPITETLFYRLLVTVDDFGRYDARPSMIKAHCFPIKESIKIKDCAAMMQELISAGLIIVYTVDGKEYLQMCKWDNIPRAKESKFPQMQVTDLQMHTDVKQLHTDVPLTVTVTVTETETKTETETVVANAIKGASAPFVLPTWINQQHWDTWHSCPKRKKANSAQKQLAVDKLAKWRSEGIDYAQALENAAIGGWQGLFEPKPNQHAPPNKQEALEARNRAAVEAALRM